MLRFECDYGEGAHPRASSSFSAFFSLLCRPHRLRQIVRRCPLRYDRLYAEFTHRARSLFSNSGN